MKTVIMITLYWIGFIIQLIGKFAFGYNNYTETSILVMASSAVPLSVAIFLFGNIVFEKINSLKIVTYVIAGFAFIAFIILLILVMFFQVTVLPDGRVV